MAAAFWMSELARDLRFAARMFRKRPGISGVAILCLALGMGANAAIFSVVDAVLLRPLPYSQPEQLVRLYETMPEHGPEWRGSVSWPNFRDWTEQLKGFSAIAAYSQQGRSLSDTQGAERVRVVEATANLFEGLGVSPIIGRAFAAGEDTPGAPPVVVVSEGLWKRRFGKAPEFLGQTLMLNGQPHTVIGILPEAVPFPVGGKTDLFIPFIVPEAQANSRGSHSLGVIGRLRPGVALESANTELRQVAKRLEEAYPAQQSGRSAAALLMAETVVGKVRPAPLILQGAVALVLLIACANVANLLLAHATMRRQEVSLRLALGATHGRVVRQLIAESLLIAFLGALLGLLLASWGLDALSGIVGGALPLTGSIALQGRVFVLLLVLTMASAVLIGLFPALQATREELRAGLSEPATKSSPSRAHRRFRGGLVVAEVALSLVLLVGAGLLLRGFIILLATEPGVDAHNVLSARMSIPASKYPQEHVAERLLQPILERAHALPGVRSAALITFLPFQGSTSNGDYGVEGEPTPEPGKQPLAEYRVVSPGFFQTLGIPLLAGRSFTEQDGQGEWGVIVNRALARRHFDERNTVGRRLLIGGESVAIVGVVGDVRQTGLDQQPLPEIYLPYNHANSSGWIFQDVYWVVKTESAPMGVVSALREAVRAVDAEQPLDELRTLDEVIERSVAARRMSLTLLGILALIALVLATAGLYGVISYLVAQRTREIGIRVALGARPGDVVRLVLRQGMLLAMVGIGIGMAGALALSRLMESVLYGVQARDPITFGVMAVLLIGTALVATWIPARRAAHVDPIIAMRGE
jgi:putative ABC transport system permease protein